MLCNNALTKCDALYCDRHAVDHVTFKFGKIAKDPTEFIHKNYCEPHIGIAMQRFTIVLRGLATGCPPNCKEFYVFENSYAVR